MGKRLTYKKSDLIQMAKDVPYVRLPYECLTDSQKAARDKGVHEFNEAYAKYKKEKGLQ